MWTDSDLALLAARGIDVAEADRQVRLLRGPRRWAEVVRPCTVGDGIERLEGARASALRDRAATAAAAGRMSRFVPASGAATRMFRDLLAWHARGESTSRAALEAAAATDAGARAVHDLLAGLDRLAFHDALAAVLARGGHDLARLAAEGPVEAVLAALLEPQGLGCALSPKGLLAFHRAAGGARTAFEEQLDESAQVERDAHGRCRAHFTVSPEHRAAFESLLAACAPRLAARRGARAEVTFSVQSPASDTLALDREGRPFRDARGALLLRPSGHGALIGNLAAWADDVVLIKNIDNVQPEHRRAATHEAWGVLAGLALETAERAHALVTRLGDAGDGAAVGEAAAFAREAFGHAEADGGDRETLRALLDRPVRVCGVVPNTGEPGGGPFWVRHRAGGVRAQIVESAEVDPHAAQAQRAWQGATHFNPVFLVCAVRDARGGRHDLSRFVDPDAVFVSHKSAEGRDLLALERPGLWNGAMAGWLTRLVHVPLEVFTPVKTVNDLLRPEHQPDGA
jgi:hypothetical protein